MEEESDVELVDDNIELVFNTNSAEAVKQNPLDNQVRPCIYQCNDIFTSQPLRAVWELLFGWAGGGKKFIRAVSRKPKGIGSSYLVGTLVRGCRCATQWSDLDLTLPR